MHNDPGQQAHTGSSQAHTVRNLQGLEAALFIEEEEEAIRKGHWWIIWSNPMVMHLRQPLFNSHNSLLNMNWMVSIETVKSTFICHAIETAATPKEFRKNIILIYTFESNL